MKTDNKPRDASRSIQPTKAIKGLASDLHGASKLVLNTVTGITDIVEAMHRNISGLAPILGESRKGPTQGITGLVYSSVRGVTNMVGLGLDATLSQLAPLFKGIDDFPQREAALAALNGAFGDTLAATNNPLAIPMQLRQNGKPLIIKKQTGRKLLVLVHGLCMSDVQWLHEDHDHGAALARDLGYTPIYLHYNTGRHISSNGQAFAQTLEQLMNDWPVAVTELVIIGHSMGGLITRSACYYAKLEKLAWLRSLKKQVFLGTPHHGAPLERAGNWVDILLSISPYTAPLARLGKIRSTGVKDLRYGNLLDEDWAGKATARTHDEGRAVPLPSSRSSVKTFVIAASKQLKASDLDKRIQGDGLVPVASALGLHDNAALALKIPATRQCVVYGIDHFDLLSSREVYEKLLHWLR